MDTKILSEIGLTQGEIKSYLALLKLGPSSTGPIAKEAQVSRAKLYMILDKLVKKGLVGHMRRGDVQYFKAASPKRLLQYADEKARRIQEQRASLEQMIPALERTRGSVATDATVYEGLRAIKNFYLGILEELRPGDTYYVIGASYGEGRAGVKAFFENYHKQRAGRKIKVKMLANQSAETALTPSTFIHAEVRFLPKYLFTNMIITFYKEKAFIFFLTREPVGILIENMETVKGFEKYFQTFWRIAKPQRRLASPKCL